MNSTQNAKLRVLLRAQAGQVTMEQAQKRGLTASQVHTEVNSGRWHRVGRGVYRLAGSPPSWQQRIWAGCLEAGGWASHRTAGWLWGLDGLGRAPAKQIDVLVMNDNKSRARDAKVKRSRTLAPSHVVNSPGVPRTTLPRTLLDLSEVLESKELEEAFNSALRANRALRGDVLKLVKPMPRKGHRGIAKLMALLDAGDAPLDSALEVRVRRLLKSAKLPPPRSGYDVFDDLEFVTKLDFAWPRNRPRVGLMVHGAQFHNDTPQWKRDMKQASRLSGLGWRVVQCTHDDVMKSPDELLRNIRRALAGVEASGEHGVTNPE